MWVHIPQGFSEQSMCVPVPASAPSSSSGSGRRRIGIYTERPSVRRARLAWDYFARKFPKDRVIELWFNPNCWSQPSRVGNAWGWWGCRLRDLQGNEHTEMELPLFIGPASHRASPTA